MGAAALTGINLASLEEAFAGSEDILAQMFALFEPQARERMAQLEGFVAAWDVASVRRCLHSLVNISGAVHAYRLSELANALGEAARREDRGLAQELLPALRREAELVLGQVRALMAALAGDPASAWTLRLPG